VRSSLNVIVVLATAAAVALVADAPAEAATATGPIVGIGGKCLDNKEGTVTNGNPIQLWTCSGLDRQRWTLPGDGTIRVQGNHCLAVQNAGTVSTTAVWLWTCDGGPAQLWTVRADGTIVNPHSGLCLADSHSDTTDGNPIWVYTCNAGPAQLWQVPASSVDPSGQPLPVGDLPGWHQVFTDDFGTDVPLGNFPAAVSSKWNAYNGFRNENNTGTGMYNSARTISVASGLMNIHPHAENGQPLIAAPIPIIPGHAGAYDGQTYGRYAVRFRVDAPVTGYKTAWLLWPDSNDWNEGEVDYPEGDLTATITANLHHRADPHAVDPYPTGTTYTSWHTAVTEWTPTSVAFYLDGIQRGIDTNTSVLPNTSMHWVLQTETEHGATPTAAANIQIDWVAVWSRV